MIRSITIPAYEKKDAATISQNEYIKYINEIIISNPDIAMLPKKRISLVLPTYDEEKALAKTVLEYLGYVDEIVIVNDGSKDNTDGIAVELSATYGKIKYIRHEKNQGKPCALRTGVKNSSGDIIIFSDADHTYPAKHIPDFVREINDNADMVLGARQFNHANVPAFNRVGNYIFSMLITYFCYTRIQDAQTGFRAMKKEVFDELDVEAKSLEYETKMTMRATKLGYNVVEIPVEYRERIGKSKLHPIRDGYRMLKSIPLIIWSESTILLKTVLLINIFMFIIGMLFGLYSVYEKIVIGALSHYFYPLLAIIFILAAIQIMSFSLIMEYIVNKLNKLDDTLRKSNMK